MYTITKSDGTTLGQIDENAPNSTLSSLALIGRRQTEYGQLIAENFVHMVENFAHSAEPAYPLEGQLWYDKTDDSLKLYNGSVWFEMITLAGGIATCSANQLIATTTTLPPLIISSTAKVVGLNADLLDGYDSSLTATVSTVAVRDGSGDLTANTFKGVATSAKYADVAERFAASEDLFPGDVVTLGGHAEICKAVGDDHVIGIISTDPALRMNEDAGDDITHPFVAYLGRVPAKVVGPVNKFAPLYLSTLAGHLTSQCRWSGQPVVARALEDKDTFENGTVLVVYGVK